MKIFQEGKDIVAKRYGFKNWEDLFDYEFENRTGKLKEYVSEASAESYRILYEDFKSKFEFVPDTDLDEYFDFFAPYIFVNFINAKK